MQKPTRQSLSRQPQTTSLGEAQAESAAHSALWLYSAIVFLGFAIWTWWGVVAVLLLQLGANYAINELFSLIAIAGLAGGCLRIAIGFLFAPADSHFVILLGVMLLILPAAGLSVALQPDTPLWVLQLLALVSGLGGGCFSAFIAAVSDLFPGNQRETALGFGAGLGHLGVAAGHIILPLIAACQIWRGLGVEPVITALDASTLLGGHSAGQDLWTQPLGYIWLLGLLPLALMTGLTVRRLRTGSGGSRKLTGRYKVLTRMSCALSIGLATSAVGLWLILPVSASGSGLELSRELILALVVIVTLMLLRFMPDEAGSLLQSYNLLNNKHTWAISVLCMMTLGSFLGFSAIFPLMLHLVFGYSHSAGLHLPNIYAPGVFTYAWMGPLFGVLMRPVGGWAAWRFGGARVTQACALMLTLSSAGIAWYLSRAYQSEQPEQYFLPFLLLFLLLFSAAGAGYASVLHTGLKLFPPGQSVQISIWMTAMAAFGVFYIPDLMGEQFTRGTPQQAMIGFALFYGGCLLLNTWLYLRRGSAFYNN